MDQVISNVKNNDTKQNLLGLLAVVGAGYFACCLLQSAQRCWKSRFFYKDNPKAKYGSGWVLVTGASDDLGLSYCQEFAKMGFNIILMGRNADKLYQAGKHIR